MPTRNIIKEYAEGHFYHVYNRGVDKTIIFRDDADYRYFLTLLKQRLSTEPARDKQRRKVAHFRDEVDLLAYCLMPNHYHLLFYLKEKRGIEGLMRSVMTAYSGYFNRRHHRVGALFQNHFLASRITSDIYLWQVSRYIHLNPADINKAYDEYLYSSLRYYNGRATAEWLTTSYLVGDADESRRYAAFVDDGFDDHALLNAIKHELAN